MEFKLQELETITDNFSVQNVIGRGGYGTVYKGVHNGKQIAVKKLNPSQGLNNKDFKSECHKLGKVQHENVVQLIGYCYEPRKKIFEHNGVLRTTIREQILCFDYMQGGCLDNHITDELCDLDWPMCYKIIIGTCEGLNHLHSAHDEPIFHLDLNPSNILLDENMTAKIADVGLPRLNYSAATHKTKMSDIGYMPPEYIKAGIISNKFDVYSLGAIIIRIMDGNKGHAHLLEMGTNKFIENVIGNWERRLMETSRYASHKKDILQVKTCVEITLRCLEIDRYERPHIKDIVHKLEELEAEIKKMSLYSDHSKDLIGQTGSGSSVLSVDPSQELRFLFEQRKDVSSCLQLTNMTDGFVAFSVKTNKRKYCAQPNTGIMPPNSKRYISVTLRAQQEAPVSMRCLDKFVVHSARVSEDLTSDEITNEFMEEGKVDIMTLPIVHVVTDQFHSSNLFEPSKDVYLEKAEKALDLPRPFVTDCNLGLHQDVSIQGVGEVRETGGSISASLGTTRPLITEASTEYAVKQSGAQERDGSSTVFEETAPSNISALFDGSVRASLGAMRPLVGKLDMLLQAPPKGCSSQSVKDKMQLLKEDVEEISSCLDELSEVEEPPLTAKCWMNQAHDLRYDIEDYIDSLLFAQPADPPLLSNNKKSTRPRLKLSFYAKILKRLKRPEQIAGTVSKFSMFIQKAIERHQRYNLHSCSTLRHRFVSLGPMLPTPYEKTAENIVIDGRMNEFINSLANDRDKQTKVISVLGSSCLGKTILSRVLYNRIGGQFDCRAFVRVSKQPDMKSIFRGMLPELQRQHLPQDCKEIDLIDDIKTYLQDKRYLVILDDLWDASVWDIINHDFPRGSHGSRIITTTQIDDVALTCCCYESKHVFQMKPLDDDHSRKLFFSTLFGSVSYSPAGKFKEDLNKIVEVCGGLPLATISIASLLVSQPVMTTELLDYIRKSLSSCFLEKSTSEKTRQALNLSFNNLPRYLKSCLLYLGMYPEGYEFFKYDLVKQWVAEGFIDTTEGQDIEKVAESYLDQLIGRRFIQPICISYNNEVVSCAVHDAIHDFIVHKSAEENFILAIDHSRKNVSLSHIVRRLSLLFGDARNAKTPMSISRSQIRSLRFSGLFECMPRIREFKLLRVLNLHLSGHPGNNDPIDLTGISELFLLRYLKIASDVCIKLPNRMRGLQCLETLDVMAATRVTAVPWDIIHLPHLFNLTLPVERNLLDLIGSMGDSVVSLWSTGKLNNLHNLHFTSSSSTLPSSDHLERSMEALGSLLGGHGNLKTLALTHDDESWHKDASRVIICWDSFAPPPLLQRFEFSPHSCITFSRIPQWLKELGNLCILKITVRELHTNCVDILRGLPALTTLSLYVDTAAIDKIIFDNVGFSALKYFKFRCSAPWLKFEGGAMPNLGKLMLGFNAIPRMDQHRHANAVITIEHMPGLKEISAKIGGATANTDSESALRTIVNHQSNPTINVQLVDYIFYGEVSTKQKQQQPDEIVGLLLGETS